MTADPKREKPESPGGSNRNRPEMPGHTPDRPETTGKNRPGTMPENPANVDLEHEPAGIDPGTDRTTER
jgi:hypothetical protein